MTANARRFLALALPLVWGIAAASGAWADDSVSQGNDSMILQRQMDYFGQRGGYVLIQDQTAQSVGKPGANIVAPAGQIFVTTIPVPRSGTVVVPGPVVAPVAPTPVVVGVQALPGPALIPTTVAVPWYGAPGYMAPGYGLPGYPNYAMPGYPAYPSYAMPGYRPY